MIRRRGVTVVARCVCSSTQSCCACAATVTLKQGGELGIFTPMLFVKGRKPLAGAAGKAASGATRGRSPARK